MYNKSLLPSTYSPSKGFETKEYKVEPLSINHAVIDLEAVIESMDRLQIQYPEANGWPNGITLHDNIVDLGWHEKEFRDRASFAYTILTHDKEKCLGCIYIIPEGDSVVLSFWLRSDVCDSSKETEFRAILEKWVSNEWQFLDIKISAFY